jgi:nucleoside-diphosphate-sugar epimerase
MRAFVTGAAGFVGRHLVPRLRRAGYQVVATDIELEISDAPAVEAAVAKAAPALLVHLAAVSFVPESRVEPERTYRVNFLGTRSVLEAARRAAPGARVLLACSADQYGSAAPGAAPFTEASPLRPHSPYAHTKVAADLLGACYAARGLDVVRTRAFNHTGPGQAEGFALPSFARQAVEIALGRREPVVRVGNLESVRDFLDVEDVVEAYLALAGRSAPAGVYNVASGRGVRIGHALGAILNLAGVEPRIEVEPERLRPTDQTLGDATRLREATGWAPKLALETTLERLVAHWRERLSAS